MTLWIAWSALLSALVALAALALDGVAARLALPRRVIWIGGLLACTIAPAVLSWRTVTEAPPVTSAARDGGVHATPAVPASATSPASVSGAQPHVRIATGRAPVETSPARITAMVRPMIRLAEPWVVATWAVASAILLLLFGRALRTLHRTRATWRNEETEIGPVLVSDDAGPAVVGFLRPRVVVPAWTLTAPRAEREVLLRHELEHVRAGDTRALFIAELLTIAFPWNAALRWMARRLRVAIEIDCDARVIRTLGETRHYALVLLSVGERYAAALPLSASLTEPRLNLEDRIDAMTAPRPRRPLLAALPFAVLAFVALTAAARAPRPEPMVFVRHLATRAQMTAPVATQPPLPPRARSSETAAAGRETAPTMSVPPSPVLPAAVPAVVPGIRYSIREAVGQASARPWERAFESFAGAVTFAAGRGRLDIVDKAPTASFLTRGIRFGSPLAQPGDYYLFDSTGFILVRRSDRTFSTFTINDAVMTVRDAQHEGPFMEFKVERMPVDSGAGDPLQHSRVLIYWNLVQSERAGGAVVPVASGHFAIADTPPTEVGVARWFQTTGAIARLRGGNGGLPNGELSLMSIPTMTRAGDSFPVRSSLFDLSGAEVDPSTLTVPSDFVETPWPGFEKTLNTPPLSADRGARWRTVPGASAAPPRAPTRYQGNPTPYYPDSLRHARVNGDVIVSLRTTPLGAVDMSSLRVLQSSHEHFTASVRDALSHWRLAPDTTMDITFTFVMADEGPAGSNVQGMQRFDDLSYGDIETIELVKGPTVAKRYGAGAESGAVVVITKKTATAPSTTRVRYMPFKEPGMWIVLAGGVLPPASGPAFVHRLPVVITAMP